MSSISNTAPDSPLARWDRPAALLLLGLPLGVVLAATFASNGATRIYSWPWAFYLQASLLAPWLWCAWSFARGRTGLRSGWWVSLPLLGALALSILTSSRWHDALEASLVLATPLVVLPFVADGWMRASSSRRLFLVRCVGGILAAIALSSLFSWLARAPASGLFRWFLTSRNPFPLGHWNYTGGLALLALPVTVLLACREQRLPRSAWIAASGTVVLQFLSAGSRGAVLGLLAGVFLAAATIAARGQWSRRTIATGLVALLVVAAGAIATNPRFRHAATDPASVFAVGESEQQRLGFILTGLKIGAAHPWTGIGPGTTPYHYPKYRVDITGSLENSFQLHCGPLQWWVDTGGIGLVLLAVVGGALKLRVWRSRSSLPAEAITSIALLGGYGAMWLTDYQMDTPIYPVLLAVAVGVLLAETEPARGAPSGTVPNRYFGLLPVSIAVISGICLASSWRARADFSSAWAAKDANDFNAFVKRLRSASDSASWQPYYRNHLARALAGIATHLPPETAAAIRAEARAAWQDSLSVAPAQDHPWLNLGWLSLADGRAAEAAVSFARAAEIQPRRTGLWFATAHAQIALHQPDAAARSLTREVRLDPTFITSPLWHEEPFEAMRPAVLGLLSSGWSAAGSDPGAAAAPEIAAFARWWWTGEIGPSDVSISSAPAQRFLNALPQIDDRDFRFDRGILPPALHALREQWRTGAPIAPSFLSPDISRLWIAHAKPRPSETFSSLVRTFAAPAIRRVQRGADGIMFRQLDGDPLSDLTEIPAHGLGTILRSITPPPRFEEFLDEKWAARLDPYAP